MISKNDILKSGIFDFKVFPVSDEIISRGKGGNRKGLLVAVAGDLHPDLNSFLEKIFEAVSYDLTRDVLFVQLTPQDSFWFIATARKAGIQKAIFFGIPPEKAGLNLAATKYQVLWHDGKTYLFADELSKIWQDNNLKRQLWSALQAMFLNPASQGAGENR